MSTHNLSDDEIFDILDCGNGRVKFYVRTWDFQDVFANGKASTPRFSAKILQGTDSNPRRISVTMYHFLGGVKYTGEFDVQAHRIR